MLQELEKQEKRLRTAAKKSEKKFAGRLEAQIKWFQTDPIGKQYLKGRKQMEGTLYADVDFANDEEIALVVYTGDKDYTEVDLCAITTIGGNNDVYTSSWADWKKGQSVIVMAKVEEDGEEEDEGEEEEVQEVLAPKIRGKEKCKKCTKPSLEGNYGFCATHRNKKRGVDEIKAEIKSIKKRFKEIDAEGKELQARLVELTAQL